MLGLTSFQPKAGTILYQRYINALSPSSSAPSEKDLANPKSTSYPLLTLQIIDPSNEVHFKTYCQWQNSDRVNEGWKERGDDEHHRTYVVSCSHTGSLKLMRELLDI